MPTELNQATTLTLQKQEIGKLIAAVSCYAEGALKRRERLREALIVEEHAREPNKIVREQCPFP